MTAVDTALWELAEFHGILDSYRDVDGREQRASPDVVLALLQALGVPIRRAADASTVLREQRIGRAQRRLEPVVVHRDGARDEVVLTLPDKVDVTSMWIGIEFEDGGEVRERLEVALCGEAPPFALGAHRYRRRLVDLTKVAGGSVAPGRHRVSLEGEGTPATALLISAPACPPAARQWGTFMPLHAVRSDDDWGIGTYTDLARLGTWVAARGGQFLGTLPLYPVFVDPPVDPSPYLPVSRLAYNESFLDPVALPEFDASEEARRMCSSPQFRARVSGLRASARVDYEEVTLLKRTVLEMLARAIGAGRLPDRLREMEAFAHRHPELAAYARFRATREPPRGDCEPDRAAVGYHLYCQWTAHEQLVAAGRAVGIYADLPIGSHPSGFDPDWSPASFVPDVSGGAPPDRFFSAGQDWGFRPLHPERMREEGYGFFTAALARAFRHADCVRLDHVMSLERLFMIPEGSNGEGAYVTYRSDEMHALVALEAHRHGTVVIGEDLGTVPEGLRPRMARENMLRTWVFQFESTAEAPLPRPPSGCLAALGTHDLPRFSAFLWGDDITDRQERGLLELEEAHRAEQSRNGWRARLFEALGLSGDDSHDTLTTAALERCLYHLARSSAAVVLVDLEELWGEHEQQNVPGTGPEEGNWRRRSARDLAQIEQDDHLVALLDAIDTSRMDVA